jgi:DNA-binding CsgD family transcriptional regulator
MSQVEDDLVLGPGELGPLLRTAKARLFRRAVWDRVGVGFHLSRRETCVAELLAAGRGAAEIAGLLGMSYHSVITYTRNIRIKLQVPAVAGRRQSLHRITAKLLLTAVGYLDHGLPGEDDA